MEADIKVTLSSSTKNTTEVLVATCLGEKDIYRCHCIQPTYELVWPNGEGTRQRSQHARYMLVATCLVEMEIHKRHWIQPTYKLVWTNGEGTRLRIWGLQVRVLLRAKFFAAKVHFLKKRFCSEMYSHIPPLRIYWANVVLNLPYLPW